MGKRMLQSKPLKIIGLKVWGPVSGGNLLSIPGGSYELFCLFAFTFISSTKYSMKSSKHNKLLMNYNDKTSEIYRGMYD